MAISIEPARLDAPEAVRLIAELDEMLSGLYPPEENFFDLDAAAVQGDRGLFVIARDASGAAIGCGAVRVLEPGDDNVGPVADRAARAEVKRMYVVPAARGTGVADQIMITLEAWARHAGVGTLVLETGIRQLAAIRLYERRGFRPIPCFGAYAASPSSRCYEKELGQPDG